MRRSVTIATTKSSQFVDITSQVQAAISEAGIAAGVVVIYCPHTTAGVTINENADPDVRADILQHLEALVPNSASFRHGEGNSPAHIKASLMGSSATVLISEGRLSLGTWQGIYLCEFDGPRTRNVWLTFIEA
jgi:secondary thiamine-phosphate synthase enzyme